MPNFSDAYQTNDETLLEFYAKPVASLWESHPAPSAWSPDLVDALRRYNRDRGTDPALNGDESVIVTGQQPGVFTGPLYTIYKAITAINLAKLHAERTGVATVPVFWIGSEDHDFDEARTIHYLTRKHATQSYSYDPPSPVEGLPMNRVPLNGRLHETIDTIAAMVNGSEQREPMVALLHETLEQSDSLADWTARVLARLFAQTPLILFAPHLPEARRLAVPILRREIEDPLETTRTLNAAANELQRRGFDPQLIKNENECSFFLEIDTRRRKIIFEDDVFIAPETENRFEPSALLELLESAPERFSPNVALRCIVQQHLFPVRAYVAGPGELAYWAQLKPVFERHELPMPVVYPRVRAVLTSPKLNKLLKKFQIDISDLMQHPDALAELANRNSSDHPALREVTARRKTIDEAMQQLHASLAAASPTAASMTDSMRDDLDQKFARIERAIVQEDTGRHQAVHAQIERLCNALMPHRKPQERVYSIVSYLFDYGPGLIDRLLRDLDVESFAMTEIEL